ncbi:hypothetical protein [Vallicoccus soli]|uniref:hypothetical protein n=1 Tax=Vallicoccus soli TaxID=2339232 RepID=UPI0024828109|nr:hypothetical protein [Vallicoccus soli]
MHPAAGTTHPGITHPRSRNPNAARCARVANLRARPTSNGCEAPPITAGSTCAPHANART